MPDIVGSLNPPRQSSPPSSPMLGQMYADTDDNTLYWWNGSIWVAAKSGSTEYALRTATGSIISVPTGTTNYTLLPLGTAIKSPDADVCFVVNGDGTITVTQAGWYVVSARMGFDSGFATNVGVKAAFMYNAADATPNPVTSANAYGAAQELGANSAGAAQHSISSVLQFPTAPARTGCCALHRDSAARNMSSVFFSIARIGAGPQGNPGSQGPSGAAGPGVAAGGSAGQVLVKNSGADYDTVWQAPVAKTFRTGHTWLISGAVVAATLPPIFIPEVGAQATTLVSVRAQILSGTNVTAQMQRNGSNLGSAITVTPTPGSTVFSQVMADLDRLGLTLSSPTGSPADLTVTAILEHVV